MVTIPVGCGRVAMIDDADRDLVFAYKWTSCLRGHTWYAVTHIPRGDGTRTKQGALRRKTLQMHRLILAAEHGLEIDHRDGDGLNNQRLNIRISTRAQNMNNLHYVRAKSGTMGVRKQCNTWQARHRVNGKQRHLGQFKTIEEAAAAYQAARAAINA